MIKQLEPVELPEDLAEWCHPDLHLIDPRLTDGEERPYTKEEWEKLQSDGGISIIAKIFEIEDICELIGKEDIEDLTGWNPEPPTKSYFLICSYSTEDALVLWWAKKV